MISVNKKPRSIVFIFAAGHSGSTLLSLMVGAHSKAFYVGEFHALSRWVNENKMCGCGSSIKECEFWKNVRNQYIAIHGLDFFVYPKKLLTYEAYNILTSRNYGFKLYNAMTYLGDAYKFFAPFKMFTSNRWQKLKQTYVALCNVVSDISKKEIIVDSTRSYRRIYKLYCEYPNLIKVLYLVRDGRAVCHSNVRKLGFPMKKAAKQWKNTYMRGGKLLARLPDESKLFLKYEEICKNPEKEARRVAEFLSINFEYNMLSISSGVGHSIAGNIMKYKPNNSINLNEAWRKELSQEELRQFNLIAGNVNREFGYGD